MFVINRTSPIQCLAFAGQGTQIGEAMSDGESVTRRINENQYLIKFWKAPAHHKARPKVLTDAITVLQQACCLPKRILNKLFGVRAGRERQMYAQRREAVTRVLHMLLHYLDLETLEVGFYDDRGAFKRLDVEYIAKQTGLRIRRCQRALSDLMEVGYLSSIRQFERLENQFKRYPSLRRIPASLLADLGINVTKLFYAREHKRKQNEKKLKKRAREMFQAIRAAVGDIAQRTFHHNARELRTALGKVEQAANTFARFDKKSE